MRIWLDPEKLKARSLTTAGRRSPRSASRTCRSPPARSASRPRPTAQDFQYTVTTLGRLSDPEQFDDIIVKTGDGDAGAR